MKVFLVQAPQWGLQPPIGLAQLGAYLLREGHDVRAFDVNIDLYLRRAEEHKFFWSYDQTFAWESPELVRSVFGTQKDFIASEYIAPIARAGKCVVGFSINYFSLEASLQLAEMVKRENPEAAVVFGGEYFTNVDWEWKLFARNVVDAVVIGDGEETFTEFIAGWDAGRDLAGCKGLCLPGADGQSRRTPPRPYIDLDKTPIADFTLFGFDRYPSTEGLYEKGDMVFMSSRGCVRNCMFCAYRAPWPGFRTMGGDRIFNEITHQDRVHGPIEHLKFYDLLINGNMRVLNRLCDLIIESKRPIPWRQVMCVIRPEMTPEMMAKMRRAGVEVITYGLESGSQHVLDLMRKHQRPAHAAQVLRATHDAGIQTQINIMTGFPGETEDDLQQTIDFVVENKDAIDFVYPSFTFTLLETQSPLNRAESKKSFGIEDDHPAFWCTVDGSNTYPIRMARYQKFVAAVRAAGVYVNTGLETDHYMTMTLAEYYEYRKDFRRAVDHYKQCLEAEPKNEMLRRRLAQCESSLVKA